VIVHDTPNGRNINRDCGSTHPSEIQRVVKEVNAQIGITHDGDADRALLCDENGEIVDGIEIMAIAAIDFLRSKRLAKETLVATVMSNFRPRRGGRRARRQGHPRARLATAMSLRRC